MKHAQLKVGDLVRTRYQSGIRSPGIIIDSTEALDGFVQYLVHFGGALRVEMEYDLVRIPAEDE